MAGHSEAIARPARTVAAILVEQKKPLVVDEVSLPETLSCGQVLVRIGYSGICGSQLGEIDGAKGPDPYLPHLLGHEGAGVVVETGPGVRKVKPGDRVVLHWMKGAGIESDPPAYGWNGKRVNAGWITTFNEYSVVSENRLTPVPDTVDPRIAALFGCAVTTGLGVAGNNAKVRIGESVVVIGAGGVGLNVIQGASLVSAYPIVGVDLYDAKLELAGRFGATHRVNSRKAVLKDALLAILGPQGADVVVDNTGLPAMIQLAYELTRPKGRTVLVGVPKKGEHVSIYTLPLHFGKVLTGSHGGETNPTDDIPRYLKLVSAGLLRLDGMITDEFPIEKINEAIASMREGGVAGKCVVRFPGGTVG